MGQALKRAEGARARAAVAPLFADWPEMLIASALEGTMGGVWTLEEAPDGALAECADFLFLAAQDIQTARDLLTGRHFSSRKGFLALDLPARSGLRLV